MQSTRPAVGTHSRQQDPRVLCDFCKKRGHVKEHCPDRQWREYRATLVPSEEKPDNSKVFCPNCAKMGHSVYDCTEERMDSSVDHSYAVSAEYSGSIFGQKPKGWCRLSAKNFELDPEEDDEPRFKKIKIN